MTTWLEQVIPAGTLSRYDLAPVFKDAALFDAIVLRLAHPFEGKIDYVAAPASLGWILGTAIARTLGVGFIAIRKNGVQPYKEESLVQVKYHNSTGKDKCLSVPMGLIPAGSRILVADEWIETGETVQACLSLIESQGGIIAGIATIGTDHNPLIDGWIEHKNLKFISDNVNV